MKPECCLPAEDSVKPNPGSDMYDAKLAGLAAEQRLAARPPEAGSNKVVDCCFLAKKSACTV